MDYPMLTLQLLIMKVSPSQRNAGEASGSAGRRKTTGS